jgi:3(or 17)beta-hydroxysteroid dehydrogenase
MDRLRDKVALVAGGASGIGRSAALLMAQEGAKIVVADVNDAEGGRVVASIEQFGGKCCFFHLDVRSEDDWTKAVDGAMNMFGRLDVVVNSAGILVGGSVEEATLAEWRELTSVDLDGAFLGLKHGIRGIKKGGRGGSIVNISSVAGLVGAPGAAAYSACKGGVRLLTKSAALECAVSGTEIRVNSIHPGGIWTPMLQATFEASGDPEAARKAFASITPLGHIGEPDDVGWVVVFLASDESKFVTGAELVVDGGLTAQ